MDVNFCGCVTYGYMWCWKLTCVLICRCHFADQQQGPILIRADKEVLLPRYHSLQTPQAVYGFVFKVYVPHFFCISAGGVAKFGPNLAWNLDGVLIGGCQLFLSPCAWGRLHYLSNLFNLSNLSPMGGREEDRQKDRQTDKWNEMKTKTNTLKIWKDACFGLKR